MLIPEGWQINPIPPFLRPKVPFGVKDTSNGRPVMVDGIKSDCIDPATGDVCGHVFLFDIDENIHISHLIPILREVVRAKDVSHLIITNTMNAGWHIWSLEIRKYKIAWYPLFMQLKRLFNSDYEFNSDWILRLGRKGWIDPPEVRFLITNDYMFNELLSQEHLFMLQTYARLGDQLTLKLRKDHIVVPTKVRLVCYKSWNVPPNPYGPKGACYGYG